MIIPDSGERVRRIVVRRWLLVSCLVVVALSLSVMGYVASDYTVINSNHVELMRLQAENSKQRQEYQRLAMDFAELRQELVVLAETDARIRLMSDLENSANDVPVGIGGAPEVDDPGNLTELQKQINSMRLAIDLRRQSQEEIRSLLNDQQSLSGSTPQGWPIKGWLTSYFVCVNLLTPVGARCMKGWILQPTPVRRFMSLLTELSRGWKHRPDTARRSSSIMVMVIAPCMHTIPKTWLSVGRRCPVAKRLLKSVIPAAPQDPMSITRFCLTVSPSIRVKLSS